MFSFGGLIESRDVGLHLEILLWIFSLPIQAVMLPLFPAVRRSGR